jgi:hypothetical protein
MIRDISDICLQDTQNHVHTFTSKYRCGSPPKEPLEEPVRDSWLRRPGPPSGRFPFSRSSNWVHTWSAGSEWTTEGQSRVSGRQASMSAHHEGRGNAHTVVATRGLLLRGQPAARRITTRRPPSHGRCSEPIRRQTTRPAQG